MTTYVISSLCAHASNIMPPKRSSSSPHGESTRATLFQELHWNVQQQLPVLEEDVGQQREFHIELAVVTVAQRERQSRRQRHRVADLGV